MMSEHGDHNSVRRRQLIQTILHKAVDGHQVEELHREEEPRQGVALHRMATLRMKISNGSDNVLLLQTLVELRLLVDSEPILQLRTALVRAREVHTETTRIILHNQIPDIRLPACAMDPVQKICVVLHRMAIARKDVPRLLWAVALGATLGRRAQATTTIAHPWSLLVTCLPDRRPVRRSLLRQCLQVMPSLPQPTLVRLRVGTQVHRLQCYHQEHRACPPPLAHVRSLSVRA